MKAFLAVCRAESHAAADELLAAGCMPGACDRVRDRVWIPKRGFTLSRPRRSPVPRPSRKAFEPSSWVAWTDAGGAERCGVVLGPACRWEVVIAPADGGDFVSAERTSTGVFLDGVAVRPVPAENP